ncbi:3-isopropylmalate dehydrogenase, partial [Frankliniella fusca]
VFQGPSVKCLASISISKSVCVAVYQYGNGVFTSKRNRLAFKGKEDRDMEDLSVLNCSLTSYCSFKLMQPKCGFSLVCCSCASIGMENFIILAIISSHCHGAS